MNAWRAPSRILAAHATDQFANLRWYGGRPGLPRWTFYVQNIRNALRCQAMTVSGLRSSEQSATPSTPEKARRTAGDASRSMAGVFLPSAEELRFDGEAQGFPAAKRRGSSAGMTARLACWRATQMSRKALCRIFATLIIPTISPFTRSTHAIHVEVAANGESFTVTNTRKRL